MAVAEQIARIQTAKENIKSSLSAKGVDVGGAKLDEYSTFIDEMQVGGDWTEYFGETIGTGAIAVNKPVSGIFRFLKKIPEEITVEGTSCQYTFASLNVENYPLIDTSEIINMYGMFCECTNLIEPPLYNTSKVEDMGFMFDGCRKLKRIPAYNTSNVKSFITVFRNCSLLEEIPLLDFGNVNAIGTYTFSNCSSLTNLGGFKDLGKAYDTSKSANNSSYTLDLSTCKKLTHDSLMNVINNLYDIASLGCNTQQLKLGATNLAKLTEEEIAIATNKGWTVS